MRYGRPESVKPEKEHAAPSPIRSGTSAVYQPSTLVARKIAAGAGADTRMRGGGYGIVKMSAGPACMAQPGRNNRERMTLLRAMGVASACGLDLAGALLLGVPAGLVADSRLRSAPWGGCSSHSSPDPTRPTSLLPQSCARCEPRVARVRHGQGGVCGFDRWPSPVGRSRRWCSCL